MSDQRFNTGNPIGSDSPLDRSDNTRDFDERMNSEEPVGTDRLGRPVLNWAGIQAAGTGDTSIAVDAAARAVAAAGQVEQDAERIAQDAAEQAVQDVVAGVDGAVQQAVDAAGRAEAASASAFVNADVKTSIEAGLTGPESVGVGEQFQVLSADGTEYRRYRKDSETVAVEVGEGFPTPKLVREIAPLFEAGSKNLFDPGRLLYDMWVNSTGELLPRTGAIASAPVFIGRVTDITISGLQSATAGRAVRFLDDVGVVVGQATISSGLTEITIPISSYPNARWVQFTLKTPTTPSDFNPHTIQVEAGRVPTSFDPYVRGGVFSLYGVPLSIERSVSYFRDNVEASFKSGLDPVFLAGGKNLFDPLRVITGFYVDANGDLVTRTSGAVTGLINVAGMGNISISGLTQASGSRGVRFLDASKDVLSTVTVPPGTSTASWPVPPGAEWVQITIRSFNDSFPLALGDIQVEEADTATSYEPYMRGALVSVYGVPVRAVTDAESRASRAYGASYLLFGDSITQTSNVNANIFDQTSYRRNWPTYAYEALEMSVFRNYALSGASFQEREQTYLQLLKNQINTAIANNENPDVIVIACGTNDDFTSGDFDDIMAKPTLGDLNLTNAAEAVRWVFWRVRQQWPDAVCFYANPLQAMSRTVERQARWNEMAKKFANAYGIILIDQNSESGIIRQLEVASGEGRYLHDGLHTNEAGKKRQSNLIVSKIVSYMSY